MNVALTNYGHRYTAELVKKNRLKQLAPLPPDTPGSEEEGLLLKLWTEISLPHRVIETKKAQQIVAPFCTPAGATGFEPAISGLTGRRVNHYTTPPE